MIYKPETASLVNFPQSSMLNAPTRDWRSELKSSLQRIINYKFPPPLKRSMMPVWCKIGLRALLWADVWKAEPILELSWDRNMSVKCDFHSFPCDVIDHVLCNLSISFTIQSAGSLIIPSFYSVSMACGMRVRDFSKSRGTRVASLFMKQKMFKAAAD